MNHSPSRPKTCFLVLTISQGLQYISMWDASEETLFTLSSRLRLQVLDLSGCSNISSRVIEQLNGLRYLDISCIKANFDKKSLALLAQHNSATLQALNLSRSMNPEDGNILDDATIASIFINTPNLTYLDLTNCQRCFKVSRGATSAGLAALANIKSIQTLLFFGVPLDLADFEKLVASSPNLHNLCFNQINPGKTNLTPSYELLSQRNLEQLVLQNITTLSDGISGCLRAAAATLLELDLSAAVGLTDVTADAIATCDRLVNLSIEGCHTFTEKGIETIVKSCTNLVVVNFGGTNVTDSNLKTLLVDVPGNHFVKKSLHTLQISGCTKLTRDSLTFIQTQKNLKVLKLSRSPFVNQDNLITLVQSTRALSYLDVSSCQNMPKQEWALKQLLQDLVEILPNANIRIQLYR